MTGGATRRPLIGITGRRVRGAQLVGNLDILADLPVDLYYADYANYRYYWYYYHTPHPAAQHRTHVLVFHPHARNHTTTTRNNTR